MDQKTEKLYYKLLSIGNTLQPNTRTRTFAITENESGIIAGPFKFSNGIFKILYSNKQKVDTDQPLVYVKKKINGEDRLVRSVVPMKPATSGERRCGLVEYSPRGPRAGGTPAKMLDLAIWETIYNPNAEIYLGFEFERKPYPNCMIEKTNKSVNYYKRQIKWVIF